jgi:GTP-binding protein Era
MAIDNFRCGTIAITGRPNVGKSTILNHIMGLKLSITSRKAQTTRHRLLGIHSTDDTQFLFVDTPGFQLQHVNALNNAMNRTVKQVLSEVDVVLCVVEAMKFSAGDEKVLEILPKNCPVLLAVNKVDLVKDKGKLLPFIKEMSARFPFADVIPISAKKSLQLDELLATLRKQLPEQSAIYGEEELTDRNEKFLAAELIREKLFRFLGEEIPYAISVEIEKFEHEGGLCRIHAAIIVDKENQKPIVIGKDGEKLKRVSTEARLDMERLFGAKVWLETWVKVRSGWADDVQAVKSLGY